MTQKELFGVLQKSGIPFRHHSWPKGVDHAIPYGVYRRTKTHNLFADGKVHAVFGHFQVELYAIEKDIPLGAICAAPSIDSEGLYEVLYEFDIMMSEV